MSKKILEDSKARIRKAIEKAEESFAEAEYLFDVYDRKTGQKVENVESGFKSVISAYFEEKFADVPSLSHIEKDVCRRCNRTINGEECPAMKSYNVMGYRVFRWTGERPVGCPYLLEHLVIKGE